MRLLKTLFIFILIVSFSFAHPGKTDSNGGHYDKSTGSYHYHHGFPAHSVCGFNCPYNNVDATNRNSSSGSSSSKSNSTKFNYSEPEDYKMPFWDKIYASFFLSFFTSPLAAWLTEWVLSKMKKSYTKDSDLLCFFGYIESFLIIFTVLSF